MALARLLPPKTSALLIDYDNAAGLFPKHQFVQRISNWLSWLKDGRFDPLGRRRRFVDKRVYWHPTNGGQQPAFEHHGFLCETCAYESGSKRGLSAVDINLAMDAIDIANKRKGALEEIVILASDSDYVSLIDKLKRKRIQTSIVVSSRDVSIVSYTGRADLVIPDEKLAEAADYVAGRRPANIERSKAPSSVVSMTAAAEVQSKSRSEQQSKSEQSADEAKAKGARVENKAVAPDMNVLAKIVEDLAHEHGGPVGREKVMAKLTGRKSFPNAGLCGKKTYREFAEAIVKLRPQLGMIIYRGGQTVSIYKKRKQPGAGGQAKTA